MSQWLFWVLLLTGVAVLGGVIAFLGDSVGRRVGRKHLRLFGLRPKTTGLVFAIGSGVLVSLATVGTVALLARSTVDNALRAQDTYREYQEVKRQLALTTEEYQSSRKDLDDSKLELQRLTQDLEFERAQLQLKQNELTATAALNGRLNTKIADLETDRNAVAEQIKEKTAELERLAARTVNLERQGRESSRRIQNLGTELTDLESQRDNLNRNLDGLNAQKKQLDERIKSLTASRAALEARFEGARTKQRQLEASVQVLEASRKTLQSDVNALNEVKTNLENSVARLESQNGELQRQLAVTESQLRATQTQLAEATSGNILFRSGELVLQAVMDGSTTEEVRTRMQALLRQVNVAAQQRGAPRSKQVTIKPKNDLGEYINGVLKTSTPDLVVIRSSRSVTQTGLEFPITVEVFANTTLYAAGQPISSRELSLSVSAANLSTTLENLGREAERQLREQGVPKENIATLPSDDIEDALKRLKGMSGTVWVAVASRQDVLPSGPIRLYISMLR
jgi:predicted  nucleic acid-binding Zn-ribbon protein